MDGWVSGYWVDGFIGRMEEWMGDWLYCRLDGIRTLVTSVTYLPRW